VKREFAPAASSRLKQLLSLRPNQALPTCSSDSSYVGVLESLRCYCRYCLQRLLGQLLQWREQHCQQLSRSQRQLFGHSLPLHEAPLLGPGEGDETRHSLSESLLALDQQLLGVDVVFCEASIVALELFDTQHVPERFADEVDKSVKACCRASESRRRSTSRKKLVSCELVSISLLQFAFLTVVSSDVER
jgi:hypothetical protein